MAGEGKPMATAINIHPIGSSSAVTGAASSVATRCAP
jgi:hypothetical protein